MDVNKILLYLRFTILLFKLTDQLSLILKIEILIHQRSKLLLKASCQFFAFLLCKQRAFGNELLSAIVTDGIRSANRRQRWFWIHIDSFILIWLVNKTYLFFLPRYDPNLLFASSTIDERLLFGIARFIFFIVKVLTTGF